MRWSIVEYDAVSVDSWDVSEELSPSTFKVRECKS